MKISTNGIDQKKIKFPVNYDLKVIMTTSKDPQENIKALEPVLDSLHIPFKNWTHKPSGKGTYTSYSVAVTIKNQETLTKLYQELGKVAGVKMAL